MKNAATQQLDSIRVLIVDDSPLMRKIICRTLATAPNIEVVGEAANAAEARAAIKALDPDVVTLDVEMPDMNSIDFLEKLMDLRPTRVIMISGFTHDGAALTIKALEFGAIDCIAKQPHAVGMSLATSSRRLWPRRCHAFRHRALRESEFRKRLMVLDRML